MKNISIIILAIAIVAGALIISNGNQRNVGNIFTNPNAYSSGVSYTSSTLTNSVAKLLLPRATSSRTMAKICLISGNTTYLYKQATSTGVVVNQGDPIYLASSTASRTCATYDANDPYIGDVWSISDATSTVSIESKQE